MSGGAAGAGTYALTAPSTACDLGLKRLLSATHGSLRHYDYNRTRPKERAQGRPRPLFFPISYYRTGRVPPGFPSLRTQALGGLSTPAPRHAVAATGVPVLRLAVTHAGLAGGLALRGPHPPAQSVEPMHPVT
jgi:hypothetical protein